MSICITTFNRKNELNDYRNLDGVNFEFMGVAEQRGLFFL